MSLDSFTEVSDESWFSRLGGAIKGVLIGGGLFICSFPLLFWNEGRAVKTYKSLNEGAGVVITVPADSANSANAGKLIHLSGLATTTETVSDPEFGVSAQALRLRRTVEMYQWKESSEKTTRKKLGGGKQTTTTYHYAKGWDSDRIDSSRFKQPDGHQNPTDFPYATSVWNPKATVVGAFQLSRSLADKIQNYAPVQVSKNSSETAKVPMGFRLQGEGYYRGESPSSPAVGDVRVSFQKVDPTDVSIVARQAGNALESYQTKAGGGIELLEAGLHSASAMFQTAHANNNRTTWLLRLLGFVVMFIGLIMVLRPLSVLADVLPLLGNVVSAGTGFIAFLAAGALSSVTIAVAWIVYRPLLGIGILVVAGGLAFAAKALLARRKPGGASETEPLRQAA